MGLGTTQAHITKIIFEYYSNHTYEVGNTRWDNFSSSLLINSKDDEKLRFYIEFMLIAFKEDIPEFKILLRSMLIAKIIK